MIYLSKNNIGCCRCHKRQVGTGLDGLCDYDICGPCMESMLVEGVPDGEDPDGEDPDLDEETEEEE